MIKYLPVGHSCCLHLHRPPQMCVLALHVQPFVPWRHQPIQRVEQWPPNRLCRLLCRHWGNRRVCLVKRSIHIWIHTKMDVQVCTGRYNNNHLNNIKLELYSWTLPLVVVYSSLIEYNSKSHITPPPHPKVKTSPRNRVHLTHACDALVLLCSVLKFHLMINQTSFISPSNLSLWTFMTLCVEISL